MIDIGVAYYRIKSENYKITYFNPDGSESGTYDLKIEKTGSIYDLSY